MFIGAGISKAFFFDEFAQSVSDFGIVWDPAVRTFAVAVCIAEIVGGIGLLLNIRLSLGLLSVMLVCFIAALIYGKILGLDIDCGCFGPAYRVGLLTQIVIDAIILVGLCFVYWTGRTHSTQVSKD